MNSMTLSDLADLLRDGGWWTMAAVFACPLVLGACALLLRRTRPSASQRIANVGIAFGCFALFVEACWFVHAFAVDFDQLAHAPIPLLLAPIYMLVASLAIEHGLHPGEQQDIRQRIRSVALFLIVLGVLYFVISRLQMKMLIFTGIFGFLFFLCALVGILYFLVRRVV